MCSVSMEFLNKQVNVTTEINALRILLSSLYTQELSYILKSLRNLVDTLIESRGKVRRITNQYVKSFSECQS
jgi:hypothetical protein